MNLSNDVSETHADDQLSDEQRDSPVDSSVDKSADCYSAGERALMNRYQQFKQWLLHPLLVLLAQCGVTPDQISIASLLLGIAFCPLYLISDAGWTLHLAYALLFLHLLIDGIDGPLARHLSSASRGGSFIDTVCDQIVVASTCIAMMAAPLHGFPGISVVNGGVHLFLYTSVVAMAMVRNAMGIPYSILVRPRNIVYGWLFLESYFFRQTPLAGSIEWLVWFFNLILGLKFVTGIWNIRRALN